MRCKWLFLTCLLFIWPASVFAAERVLIIDNSADRSSDSLLFETTLQSYRPDIDVKTAGTAVGLDAYEAVFIFGEQVMHLPEALEEDLLTYTGKIIVVGYAPESRTFWKEWQYGNDAEVLSLDGEPLAAPLPIVSITPPDGALITLKGERYDVTYPYIIQKGRHYVIASAQVEGIRQLLLNGFFSQLFPIEKGHQAFIRIENISVNTDTQRLERIASYLKEKEIPLLLSIDPKPKTKTNQTLKDKKRLIELVTTLQDEGARVVVKSNNINYDKDIRYLAQLGLYPFGIETDQQPAGYDDYALIRQYSSLYFQQTKNSPEKQTQHILPGTINGLDQFTIYPTTVELTDRTDQSFFRTPEHQINLLTSLETGMLSFSYSPYMDIEPLQDVINQMARMQNISWIEWDRLQTVTKTLTQTIRFSEDGSIQVDNPRPIYNKVLYIWESKSAETILWLLAGFVLLFVLLFTVYIIFMRIRLRKRLFNERK